MMIGIRIICGIMCFIIGYMISIFLDKRHTKKEAQKELLRIEEEKKKAKSEKGCVDCF